MKYLLLLLLPAVAVGDELVTYCQNNACYTRVPVYNQEITERFERREETNRDTWKSVQENLNREPRDYNDTRLDHSRWNDLDE